MSAERTGPGRFGRIDDKRRAEIMALAKKGLEAKAIAARVGVDRDTVRRWIDPDYRERRNRQVAAARGTGSGSGPKWGRVVTALRADVAARRAEIPPDTRNLTARLLGDPIPGDTRDRRGILP